MGDSSGIGRAVAILFAREGADVTIVHLPQEQPDADDTIKAIENEGRKGLSIAFDLENFKQSDQVIKKHLDAFGRIDILVNNASKQTMEPDFTKIDLDSVESTFRSNILQMFAITKFALPHMSKGSSIINTTSVTTFKGSPAMVDYTSTKGAIVGFTRALAANLTPKGIVSHPSSFVKNVYSRIVRPARECGRTRTRTHALAASIASGRADGGLRRALCPGPTGTAIRDRSHVRLPRQCRSRALLRADYAPVSVGRLIRRSWGSKL